MVYMPMPDYRPDVAGLNSPYSDYVKNLFPAASGYRSIPGLSLFGPDLIQDIKPHKGGVAIFAGNDPLGGVFHIMALNGTLYFWGQREGHQSLWLNVSYELKVNAYRATMDAPWSFAQFGPYVIAVNKNDKPQILDLSKKNFAPFTILEGAPQAAIVKVWGDFVCLLNLKDHPNRIHWSGLNDIGCWKIGEKFCDYQDFMEGGEIRGASDDKNPIILLENAIYKGNFLPGSDIVFSFQKLYTGRGARHQQAVANADGRVFFADNNGFFEISYEGQLSPIGAQKIDQSFFRRFNNSPHAMITAVIDPTNSRVYWPFGSNGEFNEILIYDWLLKRWSRLELKIAHMFRGLPFNYAFGRAKGRPVTPELCIVGERSMGALNGDSIFAGAIALPLLGGRAGRPFRLKNLRIHSEASCALVIDCDQSCQKRRKLYELNYSEDYSTAYESEPVLRRKTAYKNDAMAVFSLNLRAHIMHLTIELKGQEADSLEEFISVGEVSYPLWQQISGVDLEMVVSGRR